MRFLSGRSALSTLVAIGLISCMDGPTAPKPIALGARAAKDGVPTPSIVISQVYGGGGNAGATYKNDFIELFNPTGTAVNVNGWSVQDASSTGNPTFVTPLTGTIQPGAYYLVQEAAGAGGTTSLPTPDATGNIAMGATNGKVWLVSSTTLLSATACPTSATIIDQVSYGSGSNCGHTTTTVANTTAAIRNNGGCAYTGNVATDFTVAAPTPRNSATATHNCVPVDPVSVAIDQANPSINLGSPFSFTAKAFDGATPPNVVSTTFTWTSSDHAVADIDLNTGAVTTHATGTTSITVTTTNGKTATTTLTVNAAPAPADVVISQIYGGGGNSGAQYTNDYVELYNHGVDAVNLAGWSVQYTSGTATNWSTTGVTTIATGSIAPGKYFLVQLGAGAGTADALPTPDATGTTNLSATTGKVLLAQPGVTPTGQCPTGTGIADHVNFGTANCSTTWGGSTSAPSNTSAAFRVNDGCVNTGNATNDFVVLAPNPRNSASPAKSCGGGPARQQSTATLAINEVMGDPANAESASWGEWFEVYNYGALPINLKNWKISSGGTSQPDHTIASDVIVAPGGYAVLGRGGDITRNGGVTLDYNYFVGTASTIWLDDSDYLMMLDPAGARADSVQWTSMAHGVSKGLRDASQAHIDVDGTDWGYSSATFGDGDLGTPDAANGTLTTTAPVISANKLVLSGRSTSTDGPVPVGFEAQEFVSETTDAGVPVTTTTFTWSSTTPGLASIDQRGVIHGLGVGDAHFSITSSSGAHRNFTITIYQALQSAVDYGDNAGFGELTAGGNNDDYLLRKREYTTSYNRSRGSPNWVAYHLSASNMISGADRCNCFTLDPELVDAGFPMLTTADYTGAGAFASQGLKKANGQDSTIGIDRGHMTRSFDRTAGSLDNARTFLLANVVPQFADLNQGPWANYENSLGALATSGKEVYIYVGPQGVQTGFPVVGGSDGSVKNEGKITIPKYTWKVAAILPPGKTPADVHDYRDLDVQAVVMPNTPGIRNVDWAANYVVNVAAVEQLTGYHFFANLSARDQRALKTGIKPPIGNAGGAYNGIRGNPVSVTGAGSVDPNGTVVSYDWTFGDGGVASGASATHTYMQTGNYNVRLVVVDNDGLADTVFTTANIAPRPAPTCGLGKFENEADGFACDPAPAGYYVGVTDATAATPCAPGTYQPAAGQSSCVNASAGHYVDGSAAIAQNDCAIGFYQANVGQTSCIASPAGSYVGTTGAAAATPCPAGSFQSQTAASNCVATPAGSYASSPGSSQATPCAPGFYQPNTGQVNCIASPAGSYVSNPGSAVATECGPGTFSSTTAAIECASAGAGHYVGGNGATGETPCPIGAYQGQTGATSCVSSPAGSYVPNVGSAAATPCAPGYYQPSTGQSSCISAPPGSYVNGNGAVQPTQCGLGSFQSQSASTGCTNAPAGTYVNTNGATSATPCAAGFYQPNAGTAACIASPAGSYVPTVGSAGATPCAAGYYQPNSAATSCIAAPIGSYVDVIGGTAATPCPVGMTTNSTATTSPAGCVWLPPATLTQQAKDALQQLVADGALSSQEANAIQVSIDQALASIARGNLTAAKNQLGAARNKVSAAVNSGKLTAAQAADLLAAIDRAVAHM